MPQSASGPRHAKLPLELPIPTPAQAAPGSASACLAPGISPHQVAAAPTVAQLPSTRAGTAPGLRVSPLTSVGSPDLLHAVPHEDDARQLREGLDDVEVAQGAHLKEGHAVLLGVGARLLRRHLPLEGQVQPVPHQDPRDTWGMLGQGKKWRNRGYTQHSA